MRRGQVARSAGLGRHWGDEMENGLIDESRDCAALVLAVKAAVAAHPDAMTERVSALLREMEDVFLPLTNIAGRHGEDRSCALFDYGIRKEMFDDRLHPGVDTVKKEHQLPAGRVDRLLEHDDGSFTVVEVKPSGSRRDIAQGLGQAILYAASMRSILNDNRDVRPALFVSSDYDHEIAGACKMAGVAYLCFPRQAQALVDQLAAIHLHGR